MKDRKIYTGIIGGILLLVAFCIISLGQFLGGIYEPVKSYEMSDGWEVQINNEMHHNIDVSKAKFDLFGKGDTVIMKTTMPNVAFKNAVLKFYSVHCTMIVTLDGQEIFRYGQELYEEKEFLGYGFHYIEIPEQYEGKELCITLNFTEKNTCNAFTPPILGNSFYMYRNTAISNRMVMAILEFLIVFGAVLFIITLFFITQNKTFFKLMYISLFAISMGLWSFCNYDLVVFITYNPQVKAIIEFGSLYISPAFVIAYFAEDVFKYGGKWRKRSYFIIEGANIAFVLFTYTLQLLNILHFPEFLRVYHAIVVISMLYIFIIMMINAIKYGEKRSVLMMGLLSILLFALIDVIGFELLLYTKWGDGAIFKSSLYLGVLAFVIALILDFCFSIVNTLYVSAESAAFERMAYTDCLTGLANRRKCEMIFDEIDKENTNFAIVMFDLNNLKKVNDGMGHQEGDLYIKIFSRLLKETFSSCSTVARIGGDEFLVIIKKMEGISLEKMIEQLQQKIKHENKTNVKWYMSTAYGICTAKEEVTSIREAYKIADQRMYAQKVSMKQNRA